MALALNNLQKVHMPLKQRKQTSINSHHPNQNIKTNHVNNLNPDTNKKQKLWMKHQDQATDIVYKKKWNSKKVPQFPETNPIKQKILKILKT